jgi:hypothetical protein
MSREFESLKSKNARLKFKNKEELKEQKLGKKKLIKKT